MLSGLVIENNNENGNLQSIWVYFKQEVEVEIYKFV